MKKSSGMNGISLIDYGIILALQKNGRASLQEISEKVGTSKATVQRRLNNLQARGIITATAIFNHKILGYDSDALILIKVQPGWIDRVSAQLVKEKNVMWAGVATGAYDIIIRVVHRDSQDLGRFIKYKLHKIKGIVSTQTVILLSIEKWLGVWLPEKSEFFNTSSEKENGQNERRLFRKKRI